MIRFYLKIENKMLTKNLLLIVSILILILNAIVRVFPRVFIHIPSINDIRRPPIALFNYCDGYLLMLFIILIFFILGVDFNNSMEEIGLAIGGSKTNKFIVKKLIAILTLYLTLYIMSFINIYTLYLKHTNKYSLIPLGEILFYSLVTNVFIISLSLFLLFLFRDIVISTTILTAFYLVEEMLWRCKIMQTKGVIGHIYRYDAYGNGEIYKVKFVYIALSLVLIFATYMLSRRKVNFNFIKRLF